AGMRQRLGGRERPRVDGGAGPADGAVPQPGHSGVRVAPRDQESADGLEHPRPTAGEAVARAGPQAAGRGALGIRLLPVRSVLPGGRAGRRGLDPGMDAVRADHLPVRLTELFPPEAICLELEQQTKSAVIEELVRHAVVLGYVPPGEERLLLDTILQREDLGSTALGHG